MATFLYIVCWPFTIRPVSWLIEKIHSKNWVRRAYALEVHYFLVALLHTILTIYGLKEGNFAAIIGIIGLLSLSYMMSLESASSADEVMHTKHDGYIATVSGDNVTVRENIKLNLSGTSILFLIFSPLNVIIRFINVIISTKTLSADSEYMCVLGMYGHATDNPIIRIFVDVVKISDYCSYHGYDYSLFKSSHMRYGRKSNSSLGASSVTPSASVAPTSSYGVSSDIHDSPRGYAGIRPTDPDDIVVVPVSGENGEEVNIELWDYVFYNDQEFVVVHPVISGIEDDFVYIYHVLTDAKGEPSNFEPINDWALSNAVYDTYLSDIK